MERRAIAIEGVVQGVGFRPYVFSLASRFRLGGFVKNQTGRVCIEVEGEASRLDQFLAELERTPPPLAQIERLSWTPQTLQSDGPFRIAVSDGDALGPIFISPDIATCHDCLRELFDPTDRRFRYPFLNCTNCGPRLTIITGSPYDRARTTMAAFPMCAACQSEYGDPANRRFHAQPTACPDCGPKLRIVHGRATGGSPARVPHATASEGSHGQTSCPWHDPVGAFAGEIVEGRATGGSPARVPHATASEGSHGQTSCPWHDPVGAFAGEIVEGRATGGSPARVPRATASEGSHGRASRPWHDPVAAFVAELRAGRIGAIKGLGGYHLTCDAANADAVRELRRRKVRDEKPFALMVRDSRAAEHLCFVNERERALLESPRRPIVLLRKKPHLDIAEDIAPGNPALGIMLPYTPLHHLLLAEFSHAPLVMTSGNRADEPIASNDDDALARLGGIADVFLMHDRPIHIRCDDSVTRVVDGAERPLRRSRGYAPQPIVLPVSCPGPILAVGGQMKGAFALGRNRHAFVSHHLGDLDHYQAFRAFERDRLLYQSLFQIHPERVAHDLHPNYATTRFAQENGLPLVAVQHHHAHMASGMAENGLAGPVIGVTFDGAGYGLDGTIWGGEFLVGDYRQFRRAAHLRPVPMPGGERAIREPWRMALAHLRDADVPIDHLERRIAANAIRTTRKMLERNFNSPLTSSAGRLFDAVACIAGIRDVVNHEGQAAMEMEWLASDVALTGGYEFDLVDATDASSPLVVDCRPLIRAIDADVRHGVAPSVIARRFHTTTVELIVSVCRAIHAQTGIRDVVLSGGVFMNAMLTSEVSTSLTAAGFNVFRHRLVPPNDGGLCLGQLMVAAHTGSS